MKDHYDFSKGVRGPVVKKTVPDIQELRRWSAEELIGYRRLPASGIMNQDFYEDRHEQFICWAEPGNMPNIWAPDSDQSPAWQILKVVQRMSELGLYLTITCGTELYTAYFCELGKVHFEKAGPYIRNKELQTAILQAAHAAWEGE